MNEFALIEKIKKKIPRHLQGKIGIGDDAGVLISPPGEILLWTTDAMVEGVDFYSKSRLPSACRQAGALISRARNDMGYLTPEQVGRKALAINLSDLAAMGAKPLGCVVTLGIPQRLSDNWILRFYEGFIRLAREYQVACVGGDLTRASEFFVSVALAGSTRHTEIVRRNGARSGNWIAVTGALGGSIKSHHASFTPRIREARFLVESFKPTSMIDISDGLLQDLGHLLKNSRVGASLDMTEIPISQDAMQLAGKDPRAALERACTDGEDFELLFTVPEAFKSRLERAWKKHLPNVPLSWIGKIEKQKGVRWTLKGKSMSPLRFKEKGYRHF